MNAEEAVLPGQACSRQIEPAASIFTPLPPIRSRSIAEDKGMIPDDLENGPDPLRLIEADLPPPTVGTAGPFPRLLWLGGKALSLQRARWRESLGTARRLGCASIQLQLVRVGGDG